MFPSVHLPVRVVAACLGLAVACCGLAACSQADAAAKKSGGSATTIAPPKGDPWPYITPKLHVDHPVDDVAKEACAVAEYFVNALPYDAVHLRTDTIDKYGDAACLYCEETAALVKDVRKNGGWIRDNRVLMLQPLDIYDLVDYDGYECDFHLVQDKGTYWRRGYKTVKTIERDEATIGVDVINDHGSWKILSLGAPYDSDGQ